MGEMLRSDLMTLCDLFLPPETAFDILSHLGELGCAQFKDVNSEVQAFQRHYVPELCRCAEMERKLRYIEEEMTKDHIYIPKLIEEPKALQPHEMRELEAILERWENVITEMSTNQTHIMKAFLELTEMLYVLHYIGPVLGNNEIHRETLLNKRTGETGRLVVMAGLVQRRRCFAFETMMWRVCHGDNYYYCLASEDKILQDPYTGQDIRKVAFLAICQGEALRENMEKVCSGFGVHLYPCPTTMVERMDMTMKLERRLDDLEKVITNTKYHRCKALRTVGRQWTAYMIKVKKAKAIYHTMNLFTLDITSKCLIGQCWIPTRDVPIVQSILDKCSEDTGANVQSFMSKVETDEGPPTFHRTNKFTHGFQALINAYGESTYRELNPGLYTIITFPFLFALMFGDIGHGCIMLSFALWMLKNEKRFMAEKSTNEIWVIFFGGRYIILLMSIFSIYVGFIYNDVFSLAFVMGTSGWSDLVYSGSLEDDKHIFLEPKTFKSPYFFGIDPIWTLANNKIHFENSLKMKLSIIIGVIHMLFGLSLSMFNHLYFKRKYAIFLEFIPQFLFLTCLFLWLVILIYFKWFTYGANFPDVLKGEHCAPLILLLFIDMALMSTTKPVEDHCDAYMFEGQQMFQTILLFTALAMIPVMLFGIPLYVYRKNQKKVKKTKSKNKRRKQRFAPRLEKGETDNAAVNPSEQFSEVMMHQAVHTIEFVLSTISHTASYLRLWALSLAHAQLSEMLWMMVFSKMALQDSTYLGSIKIVGVFAIWAAFSLAILVLMEGLSAFLHTLRLHWVEFMSKFYGGGGYIFQPFSFKSLFSEDGRKSKIDVCSKKIKKLRHDASK